ncbi:unnamed protein product, partial [Ectocarpus sp. 12 AP-2014]
GDPPSAETGLEWQVGWFVAFPQGVSNPVSVVVGKIAAIVRQEEGDEVRVHWYASKSKKAPRRRSLYGKGGLSQLYKLDKNNKRIPDVSKELVNLACATFPSLLAGTDRLPGFIWDSVAENVPPP